MWRLLQRRARAVLADPLGRQQHLQRDAQACQCAIRMGQRHAPAGYLMTLRPGLAIGGCAFSNPRQGGDESRGVECRWLL